MGPAQLSIGTGYIIKTLISFSDQQKKFRKFEHGSKARILYIAFSQRTPENAQDIFLLLALCRQTLQPCQQYEI